jgi:small conductance mechanosensitive channel
VGFLERHLDLSQLVTATVGYLPHLVAGLVILFGFWLLFRLSRRPLSAALSHTGLHDKLVSLLINGIYKYTLAAFGMVMALSQLGVNVGAAIAGLGVAGIAIGLAAQDTLANTIAGFTIFWDKPFVVGDWVTVSGQYGEVQDITLRSTRIRTPRNSFVVIPNKRIIDEVLENDSKHGEVRVEVPIGIAFKEDTAAAREAILTAVRDADHVLSAPKPRVVVTACADSSINLEVQVWIPEAGFRRRVFFAVLEKSKHALDKAGIEIPFPHLQVFWEDMDARVVEKLSSITPSGKPAGKPAA